MLKQFMIEKVELEVLTEKTGTITFHLADENGDCRTVTGQTFLDENQQPRGVSTDNTRELPLIESLFSNRNRKTIEVEFDHFNKVYDRETDKTINQLAYEAVVKMKDEDKLTHRISKLFKRKEAV